MSVEIGGTQQVAHVDRADFWRELNAEVFGPLQVAPVDDTPFHGTYRSLTVGTARAHDIFTRPCVVARSGRNVDSYSPDGYKLTLQVSGSNLYEQDGRQGQLRAGDFLIYDCTRPYRIVAPQDGRILVVMFPRDQLRLTPEQVSQVTVTPFSGTDGLGSIASTMLTGLVANLDDLTPTASHQVARSVIDLVETCIAERLDIATNPSQSLVLQIKDFIERNLSDPDLGPSAIAAAHYISVRYVHRLFEAEGVSVSRYITNARFERIRWDLADPSLAHVPVRNIAARWGIHDPSRFSRTFKEYFGTSPREYRAIQSS